MRGAIVYHYEPVKVPTPRSHRWLSSYVPGLLHCPCCRLWRGVHPDGRVEYTDDEGEVIAVDPEREPWCRRHRYAAPGWTRRHARAR